MAMSALGLKVGIRELESHKQYYCPAAQPLFLRTSSCHERTSHRYVPFVAGSNIRVQPGLSQSIHVEVRNRHTHRWMRRVLASVQHGPRVARENAMNFAKAVDLVREDFSAMPGLELTCQQAVRLWGLGADDCRFVVDALVDAGFLQWTPRRTIVRTGRGLDVGIRGAERQDVRVRTGVRRHKSF